MWHCQGVIFGVADLPVSTYQSLRPETATRTYSPKKYEIHLNPEDLNVSLLQVCLHREISRWHLTQGFRTALKMYGDKTVRPMPTITGFTDGVSIAGQELITGLYDGLSGFVVEPIKARKSLVSLQLS